MFPPRYGDGLVAQAPLKVVMHTYLLLSVGSDPELMKVRTLVLLNAGYAVRQAVSAADAVKIFKAGDFDLVVLCHSIPEKERLSLIAAVRDVSPSVKIIVVRKDGELSSKLADETVHSLDGPEALIEAVKETLGA